MPSRKGAQHASNILGALTEAARPMSAYDLLDKLRPTGVAAPLTVYRALDKLVASGKVHRIESLNAFVACRHDHHRADAVEDRPDPASPPAVAFTICDKCGAVEEFADAELFALLQGSVGRRQFTPRASAVEVHGLCGQCRDPEGR